MPEKLEIGCQTDSIESVENDQPKSILYCWQDASKNDVSTQTLIIVNSAPNRKIIDCESFNPVLSKNVSVNTDEVQLRPGFTGFANIDDDTTMKQLGGITLSFFIILLNCINLQKTDRFFRKLGPENRLLLFLMKMILGLDFSAISCILRVSRTTASNVFYDVLDIVFRKTKTWICWPSREAIKMSMPSCFDDYPNCRAIIDCAELYCDTPPTVEQRALMYSSYKSAFTLNYLIGISPSGYITHISIGFGGRTSDGMIVNSSGFIKLVEPK